MASTRLQVMPCHPREIERERETDRETENERERARQRERWGEGGRERVSQRRATASGSPLAADALDHEFKV